MSSWKLRVLSLCAIVVVLAGLGLLSSTTDDPDNPGHPRTVIGRMMRSAWDRMGGMGVPVNRDKPAADKSKGKAAAKKGGATKSGDKTTSCGLVGIVINEERKPIKDAKITVRATEGHWEKSFQTGEDGRFRALNLPEGVFNILATHPKFVSLIRPSLTIEPAPRPAEIEFRMPLGAELKGKVKDEEGKPLDDVRVAARRRSLQQLAGGEVFQDDSTYKLRRTDTDGTFTLEGVAIGENVFEFFKRGYQLETVVVDVRPDKKADLNNVVLRKTGRISGIVTTEQGRPLAGSVVSLTRYRPVGGGELPLPADKMTTTTGSTGEFAFGKLFTEGAYDIRVENPDYAPAAQPSVVVGTERLTIQLGRGGIIYGRTEFIDRESTPVSVMVVAEAVVAGTTVTRETRSTGAGTFRFDLLPYGKYKLDIVSSQYVSEGKAGVEVQKGKAASDVVVEVYEAATVRGRVQDLASEAPIAGAKVKVEASYGVGQARKKSFQVETNALGMFEFRQLPGGLHTAQAEKQGYARTPGASAQTFTLNPGERKADVSLRLDQGGTVDGFVLDPNGRPLPDAEVQLYAASTAFGNVDSKNLKAKTDGSGYFSVRGIEYGERIQLYASAKRDGYAKTRSPIIDLTEKKRSETTQIHMNLGGTITGKVTDGNDLPIPGVEITFSSHEFPSDPSSSRKVVHTRADGGYAIPNIPPGSGGMKVTSSGYVEQHRSIEISEARMMDNVNFRLDQGNGIAGRVTSLDGRPIADARVTASPRDGATGRDDAVTDKDGRYQLKNLGTGTFDLRTTFKFKTSDGEQGYTFLLSAVPAGTQSADFDCDVDPTVSGNVKGEDGKGVDKFTLTLRSRTDRSVGQDFVFNLDRNYDAARGFFRVLNIPRGVYSLRVVAQGYETHEEESVFVGPRMRTTLREIRLKQAGGVYGTVISGKSRRPVNNVRVQLIDLSLRDDDPKRTAGTVRTDFAGRFHINTIGTGNYSVKFDHPNYVPLTLASIRVEKRKPTDLGEQELEAGGTVQGTVTDAQGQPVRHMEVRASGVTPRKRTNTDGAGNFILQGIPEGRVPIVLEGDYNNRRIYQFQTVMVEAEESETANFTVETGADLDGSILTAEGSPRGGTVSIHPFDENAIVLDRIKYSADVAGSKFAIDQVPTGQYFLWSTGYGAVSSYSMWRNIFLRTGRNPLSLSVSSARLRGQATAPDGSAAPGVGLQLLPIVDGVRLPQSLYDNLVQRGNTKGGGMFDFGHLQPGSYQLLYQDTARNPSGGWMALPPFFIGDGQVIDDYPVTVGK